MLDHWKIFRICAHLSDHCLGNKNAYKNGYSSAYMTAVDDDRGYFTFFSLSVSAWLELALPAVLVSTVVRHCLVNCLSVVSWQSLTLLCPVATVLHLLDIYLN